MYLIVAAIVLAFAGAAAYVYLGVYNVAADEKHWAATERFLQSVRMRSVRAHSRQAGDVPDLDDAKRIQTGAGQYAEMCVQCHLAPGAKESPLRQGLYPQPPDLTQVKVEPRAAFWVIKHGIKMTGMPAWGASHDDATIWALVAFLQKLPGLDANAYAKMVKEAPADEEMRPKGPAPSHEDTKPHGHKE